MGDHEAGLVGAECQKLDTEDDGENVHGISDPKLPSTADIDEHWLMRHAVYRNWCEICMRAKGRGM